MNKMLTKKEMSAWIEETWEKCQKEAWGQSEMTRDDILRFYDQALVVESNGDYARGELDPIRFAELVAEKAKLDERERCAKICDNLGSVLRMAP